MNGWFKVHRKMWDHVVWKLSEGQRCVWLTCLAMANHDPADWWDGKDRVEIPAGSFVTSQPHLAQRAGVGRQVVRSALDALSKIGSISTKIKTKRWTMIEVANWTLYQGSNEDDNQDSNQVVTKWQPSDNHKQEEQEGKECKKGSSTLSLSLQETPPPVRPVDALAKLWNQYVNESRSGGLPGFRACRILTGSLEVKMSLRLKEEPDLGWWEQAIKRLAKSRFASGGKTSEQFPKGWRATLRWFVTNDSNAVRAYEGEYDD